MATTSFRSYAVVSLLMIFFIQPSISIYCDEDDCYDLLGVSQNANASEIKRAYYKLSLKHHPDKNPDPQSKKLFVKIANAYEILKDEVTRGQYDYAIEHPEEVFYNTARYYHAYYGHKTDPRAVLLGLLLVLSGIQYLNQWTRYNQAIDMVKRTPAYKNKLKALELERTGAMPSKKKGGYKIDKKMQEDLSKELELQIKGAEKPSMWGLLGVRFILLPYTLGKLVLWYGCWYWRYKINRTSYSWEDASYLTRRALGASPDSWEYLDESTKKDLIDRRLWVKSNLESYLSEMRKESKRRRTRQDSTRPRKTQEDPFNQKVHQDKSLNNIFAKRTLMLIKYLSASAKRRLRCHNGYWNVFTVTIITHGRLQPGFYKAIWHVYSDGVCVHLIPWTASARVYKAIWHVYGLGLILLNFDSSSHGRLQPGFDKTIWHVYEIRILFSFKLIA